MRVIAALDPVPVEPGTGTEDKRFIDPAPAEPVEVEPSSYYQRRIASGELQAVKGRRAPSGAKSTANNETSQ